MKGLVSIVVLVALAGCGGHSPTSPSDFNQTVTGTVGTFDWTVHPVTVPRSGNMTAVLTWSGSADLDFYLTDTSCAAYPPLHCTMLAESNNITGNRETITRTVSSGDTYKLWVDNFSTTQSVNYSISMNVH